jgi:hypothetical protein
VLAVLTACTAQPGDGVEGRAAGSPPEDASPSPTSRSDEIKSAEARCRHRVAKVKHQEFIPETYREGASEVLPVVFPDGSSAELVYPPGLRIAELGVQPAVSVGIEKARQRFAHVRFLLITRTPIKQFRSEGPPVTSYEGASGTLRVWRAKDPEEFLSPVFLHFRIGGWNILVGDGNSGTFMGPRNRSSWAENLDGHETDNGFIILKPRAPLAIARGKGGGPDLWLSECFRFVELRLERCQDLKDSGEKVQVVGGVAVHRHKSGRQFYANWCTPSGQVSVYLDDRNQRFIDLAVRRLRVLNVDVRDRANAGD